MSFRNGRIGQPNRDPLRKIVDYVWEPLRLADGTIYKDQFGDELRFKKEKLECGHIVSIKKDIFGETNAARRRCRQCAKMLKGMAEIESGR